MMCALQDRRIGTARRRLEAIAERLPQPLQRRLVGMDIDQPALLEHVAAQIVDAVDVVGMRMRVDDGVDALDRRHQHLLAEIRPGVDDDRASWRRSPRCARPVPAQRVRRFFGLAGSQLPQSPVMRGVPGDEPQPRIVRRSRSLTPQAPAAAGRGILPKSRKKLSVVIVSDLGLADADRLGQHLARCCAT